MKLKQADMTVDSRDYKGVTYEFFEMGMVVDKAKVAADLTVKNLKASFAAN